MSSLNVKAAPVVVPTTGLEQLQKKAAVDLESEKARLKEATRQFESFFMYQMLKTMRETIPESSPAKDAPLSGDKSKDIFTDMFDMQIADKMASGDSNSIADILYKSLEKVVEAQYPSETAPNEIMPLDIGEKQPLELKQDDFRQIEEDDGPIEVRPRSEDLLPIQTPVRQITEDPVMSRYGRLITETAEENGLNPALIAAVIRTESNGDPEALSRAGAKGLMQLIDSTAGDYGVSDSFDPQENVRAGSRYLKDLLDRFDSLELALAAYNAGPGNVMRYGGVPPFKETEAYVEKVMDSLGTTGHTVSGAIKVNRD